MSSSFECVSTHLQPRNPDILINLLCWKDWNCSIVASWWKVDRLTFSSLQQHKNHFLFFHIFLVYAKKCSNDQINSLDAFFPFSSYLQKDDKCPYLFVISENWVTFQKYCPQMGWLTTLKYSRLLLRQDHFFCVKHSEHKKQRKVKLI